jgi:hypothetical protein
MTPDLIRGNLGEKGEGLRPVRIPDQLAPKPLTPPF